VQKAKPLSQFFETIIPATALYRRKYWRKQRLQTPIMGPFLHEPFVKGLAGGEVFGDVGRLEQNPAHFVCQQPIGFAWFAAFYGLRARVYIWWRGFRRPWLWATRRVATELGTNNSSVKSM